MRTQGDLRQVNPQKTVSGRQTFGQPVVQCNSSMLSAAHPNLHEASENLSTNLNGLLIRAQARACLDLSLILTEVKRAQITKPHYHL